MDTFILIVFFYLFLAFVSLIFVYANSQIYDVEIYKFDDRFPSISDLTEEERKFDRNIDNYIENTICRKYHYQILKTEIRHYQDNSVVGYLISFICVILLSFIPLKIFGIDFDRWWFFPYIFSLVVSCVCHLAVWQICIKKGSDVLIRQKLETDFHDWEEHYNYLLLNKETIISRHYLRQYLLVLLILCIIVVKQLVFPYE